MDNARGPGSRPRTAPGGTTGLRSRGLAVPARLATVERHDMLVSLEHRFIFVHVPKSAGRSIRAALQPHARRATDYWTNRLARKLGARGNLLAPPSRRWLRQHTTARRGRLYLPRELFDTSFKFAFSRNPWDWLVSYYHFIQSRPRHRRHRRVRALGSFANYVRDECRRPRILQSDFVTDRRGGLLVDFVGRYETLNEDFSHVCRRIGVSARLDRRNTSRHGDYREYYDDELRALVAGAYRADIEFFGYEFDGLAKRDPVRAA